MRALRFAGHFELAIDPATWSALVAATPNLPRLSAERIREELWKIFTKTPRASRALSLYAASGALAVLIPELDRTVGVGVERGAAGATEGEADRPPLDAWARSLLAVDALPTTRPLLRMAALLHAVGMPAARTRDLRGGWRYTGHEAQGARIAEEIMRRLRSSNADTARVKRLVARQSDFFPPDAPPAGVRRWLRDIGVDLVYDLFRLRFALWRAAGGGAGSADLVARWRKMHRILLEHPVLDASGLAIDGRDLMALGLKPGPRIGEILRALVDAVIEDPTLNTRESLLEWVRREVGE